MKMARRAGQQLRLYLDQGRPGETVYYHACSYYRIFFLHSQRFFSLHLLATPALQRPANRLLVGRIECFARRVRVDLFFFHHGAEAEPERI